MLQKTHTVKHKPINRITRKIQGCQCGRVSLCGIQYVFSLRSHLTIPNSVLTNSAMLVQCGRTSQCGFHYGLIPQSMSQGKLDSSTHVTVQLASPKHVTVQSHSTTHVTVPSHPQRMSRCRRIPQRMSRCSRILQCRFQCGRIPQCQFEFFIFSCFFFFYDESELLQKTLNPVVIVFF